MIKSSLLATKSLCYDRFSSMAFCSIWSAVVTTLLLD